MDFCFGVSRLMLRQLLSQAKRISFLPSILSFSFFPFHDICSVLRYVSICTCPVLNRHCMIYKTYARVPLFQQSSPFMFSVGLYLYRLVSVGYRSYTDLNMNWIRCVPSTRFLPIFSFLSVFVHLVHASWLSITVVLAFLSCSSICRYIYIYVWHRASFLCRVWSWFKMALVKF